MRWNHPTLYIYPFVQTSLSTEQRAQKWSFSIRPKGGISFYIQIQRRGSEVCHQHKGERAASADTLESERRENWKEAGHKLFKQIITWLQWNCDWSSLSKDKLAYMANGQGKNSRLTFSKAHWDSLFQENKKHSYHERQRKSSAVICHRAQID